MILDKNKQKDKTTRQAPHTQAPSKHLTQTKHPLVIQAEVTVAIIITAIRRPTNARRNEGPVHQDTVPAMEGGKSEGEWSEKEEEE